MSCPEKKCWDVLRETPNDLGKLWKPPTVSEDPLLGNFVDLVEVVR